MVRMQDSKAYWSKFTDVIKLRAVAKSLKDRESWKTGEITNCMKFNKSKLNDSAYVMGQPWISRQTGMQLCGNGSGGSG